MGLRYRKSINIGLGFRVNFSKSGVGYSWGGKGFRVTKTATGRTRTTVGIPGSGISWVEETSGKQRTSDIAPSVPPVQNDSTHLYSIENADVDELAPAQLQDFIGAIRQYRLFSNLFSWAIVLLFAFWAVALSSAPDSAWTVVFFLAFALLIPAKIIYSIIGKVKVQYEYDAYGAKRIELISHLTDILKSNKALWQVNDVFRNAQTRTNAGAASSVARFLVKIQTKKPPFLRTNVKCYFIKLKKEKLYILPDKILVVNKGKMGAISLSDLHMVVGDTNFVENIAPRDATVIRHTWQFVNNNGTPDKRFKNNRQLPVCRYGTISFKTDVGFNTLVYCSDINKAIGFRDVVASFLAQESDGN